jgi:hypothetical protein
MRDEDIIERKADEIAGMISRGQIDHMDRTTILVDNKPYDVERLRGIKDALDWALEDEDELNP